MSRRGMLCLIKYLLNASVVNAQNGVFTGSSPPPMTGPTYATTAPLYEMNDRTTQIPRKMLPTPASPTNGATPSPSSTSTTTAPRATRTQQQQQETHYQQQQFSSTGQPSMIPSMIPSVMPPIMPSMMPSMIPSMMPYDGIMMPTPPMHSQYMNHNLNYNPSMGFWPWMPLAAPRAPWYMNPAPYRNYNRNDFLSPYNYQQQRGDYDGMMNTTNTGYAHSMNKGGAVPSILNSVQPGLTDADLHDEVIGGQSVGGGKANRNNTGGGPYRVGNSHHFSSVSSTHGRWDPIRGMMTYDQPEVYNSGQVSVVDSQGYVHVINLN